MDVYVSRGRWNYYHKLDWQIGKIVEIKKHSVVILVETNQGDEFVYVNKLEQMRIKG